MRISTVILFLLVSLSGFAQKIRYKEVFTLLSVQKYEEAEPFLKKYIAENNDANALLFMGIIYQEKISKDDILRDTDAAITHMDSAIFFYDKAYKGIDDRELRRNKDYYVMYNRRDLRTGQYGVKLSDVHYDIETRTSSLKERIDKVRMIKHYFSLAEKLYNRSNELFRSIQNSVPGLKELYLRSDENTLEQLSKLSLRFDSCTKAFGNYKSSLSNIEKAGYNQSWNLTPIENFNRDGIDVANFYNAELKIWDYKRFADGVVSVIQNELESVRNNLVKYDVEINKLRERLATDSVSVKSDLTKLVDNLLGEKIKKFDTEPFPMDVLSLKVADLEYRSTLVENIKSKTHEDVHVKLAQTRNEILYLNKVDSLASKLLTRNIDEDALNYTHFINNTYSNVGLLKNYIRTQKDFAQREKRTKLSELALRMKAVDWLVSGTDSIPLKEDADSRFKPLVVKENMYTAGISFDESAQGYFFTITPSRVPDVKVSFPVDKVHFVKSGHESLKGMAATDATSSIYFVLIYSEQWVEEKIPATVAKIYRSDGLSWSFNYLLNFVPDELQFIPESGELMVKSSDGMSVVLDKGGVIK